MRCYTNWKNKKNACCYLYMLHTLDRFVNSLSSRLKTGPVYTKSKCGSISWHAQLKSGLYFGSHLLTSQGRPNWYQCRSLQYYTPVCGSVVPRLLHTKRWTYTLVSVLDYVMLRRKIPGSPCDTYRSVPQIRPPFCNLSLSTNRKGGLICGMRHFLLWLCPPFRCPTHNFV